MGYGAAAAIKDGLEPRRHPIKKLGPAMGDAGPATLMPYFMDRIARGSFYAEDLGQGNGWLHFGRRTVWDDEGIHTRKRMQMGFRQWIETFASPIMPLFGSSGSAAMVPES